MGSTVIDQRELGIVVPVARGKWEAKTAYQKLNIVTHNFGTYIAKKSSVNVRPTIDDNWESYWMELASGRGISSTTIEYVTTKPSVTTPPEEGWSTALPTVKQGDYLWTRIMFTYTDGAQVVSYTVGAGGITGVGVKSTEVDYQRTTSGTEIPADDTAWVKTIPAIQVNTYLWTRTKINYTDNSSAVFYSVGYNGIGISTTIINYAVSDSGAAPPEDGWVSSIPSTLAQGKFLWSKTVTTYTDNSTSTVYSVAYQGENPSITIGTVTTVAPDKPATVKNVGTALDMILDIEIPQGVTGANLGDATVSESPLVGALPRYNAEANIKSSKPILNNDCVRLEDLATLLLKGELSVPLVTDSGDYLEVDGNTLHANLKVKN